MNMVATMTTINYLNRTFPVLETRDMSTGTYGKINISTSDRAAYVWQLLPVAMPAPTVAEGHAAEQRLEQGCELPPYMQDNILALAEVLNTRSPERQKSRDLYVYELMYAILEAVA